MASRQDLNKADIKEVRSHARSGASELRASVLDLTPQLVIAVTSLTYASDKKPEVQMPLTDSVVAWRQVTWMQSTFGPVLRRPTLNSLQYSMQGVSGL